MLKQFTYPTKFVTFLLLCVLFQTKAYASEMNSNPKQVELNLKPAKCVSLHQGQVCYANIELNWRNAQNDNYCLFSSTQTAPLKCWQNAYNGSFEGEISSKANVIFTLAKRTDPSPLATAEMKIAWVYKKKRASVSWRVF